MGITTTTNYNLQKPNEFEELDAWGPPLNSNCDTIDGVMKANEDAAALADSKGDQGIADAAAAQGTADAALANAATADGKAVAAQADATQAIADAAAAQGTADANTTNKAPIDSPNFTTTAQLGGNTLATEAVADTKDTAAAYPTALEVVGNYTPILADRGRTMRLNSTAAARIYTIQEDATLNLPIGFRQNVVNWGSDIVTLAKAGAANIRSAEGHLVLDLTYKGCTIEKVAANEWYAVGALSTP